MVLPKELNVNGRGLLLNNFGKYIWLVGYPILGLLALNFIDGVQRPFLFGLSLALLYLIVSFCIFAKSGEAFSPLIWFSAMYSGYVLGGMYFSFDTIHLGKFFELSGIPLEKINFYIVVAQIYAMVCYITFAAGYYLGDRKQSICPISYENNRQYLPGLRTVGSLFLLIGFVYWLYTAYVLAGGPIEMFMSFSSFIYLLEENRVTTLPYLFYFVGSHFLFFYMIFHKKRPPKFFSIVVIIGLLILLSKGRITSSLTYALSFMVMYYFVYHDSISLKKWSMYFATGIAIGLALLFLRVSSAYYYLGQDDPLAALSGLNEILEVFFEVLVGWGNVTDIQQLVLTFNVWGIEDSLFGISYFDWFVNLFANTFGYEPVAMGIRILKIYFPDKVGGPTPGAIGEAYANFSLLAPFFMFLVGFGFSKLYCYAKQSGDIRIVFIYAVFLVTFIFLYAKVDSSLFLGFLWAALPTIVSLFCVNTMVRELSTIKRSFR